MHMLSNYIEAYLLCVVHDPKRMTANVKQQRNKPLMCVLLSIKSVCNRRLYGAGFQWEMFCRCENLIRNVLKIREKRCTLRNDNGLIRR